MLWSYLTDPLHGRPPVELRMARYISDYGAEAVFGRKTLSVREMRRIAYTEDLVAAHSAMKHYSDSKGLVNWEKFAEERPVYCELLRDAMEAVQEDL